MVLQKTSGEGLPLFTPTEPAGAELRELSHGVAALETCVFLFTRQIQKISPSEAGVNFSGLRHEWMSICVPYIDLLTRNSKNKALQRQFSKRSQILWFKEYNF